MCLPEPELTLRTAEKHVKNYEQESAVVQDHDEAMECLDCEAFLDLGIDAFSWLQRATKAVRKAALHTDHEMIEAAENSRRASRKAWLGPCDMAETAAARRIARGFALPNLQKFRDCCDAMRQLVDNEDKRNEHLARVLSTETLSKMAVDPPRDWSNEPAW